MEISKINAATSVNKTAPAFKAKEVEEKPAVAPQEASDSFKKEYKAKTAKEKEEIIYKARTNASGWSIFGGVISSMYYYLRKDSTIAEKYGLDKKEDKQFIDEIRNKQTIATIPGIAGFGLIGWLGFKFFAKPEEE